MRALLFTLFLLATSFYAIRRGGGPERATGIALLAIVPPSLAIRFIDPPSFAGVETGVLAIDLLLLLALGVIAWRAARFWTLWTFSMQIIVVATHIVFAVAPDVIAWAYAAMLAFWSWIIVLTLLVGTISHRRRRRQTGADPSWRTFSEQPTQPPMPPPTH